MSDTTTRGVRVQVQPAPTSPSAARPRQGQYFFAYRVRISNVGDETVQLVSRHWVITDGEGHVEHVQGPGVVGEQPVLDPGRDVRVHELLPAADADRLDARQPTRWSRPTAASFDAEIAPFSLAVPTALN